MGLVQEIRKVVLSDTKPNEPVYGPGQKSKDSSELFGVDSFQRAAFENG